MPHITFISSIALIRCFSVILSTFSELLAGLLVFSFLGCASVPRPAGGAQAAMAQGSDAAPPTEPFFTGDGGSGMSLGILVPESAACDGGVGALQVGTHRPTQYFPIVKVKHHRQVHKAASGPQLRYVGHPFLPAFLRMELSVQYVFTDRKAVFPVRRHNTTHLCCSFGH